MNVVRCRVAVLALSLIALVGVGAAAQRTDAATVVAGQIAAENAGMTSQVQPFEGLPEHPPYVSPGACCTKATAHVGRRRGEINVVAYCHAPHKRSRLPTITVTRVGILSRLRSDIKAFRHRPEVSGPGAMRRHGVCQHENGTFSEGGYAKRTINCWARAKGKIILKARIWVKAVTRCSMRLSISSPIVEKLKEKQLFQHRPTGCSLNHGS